jgi:predicted ABC-type exoprotein transport system permease subunit
MPLKVGDDLIITAHASKKSKINLYIFQAHTSVLVPLLAIPMFPFLTTIKIAFILVFVLIVLERVGYTLGAGMRRLRARAAGRNRFFKTKHAKRRSAKNN